MRKKGYKGSRCVKKVIPKCRDVCRTFDALQAKYADMLAEDPSVESIMCNVLMDGLEIGEYTSDFVCTDLTGRIFVRECVYRKQLQRRSTLEKLAASQKYWHQKGIDDWKLVIDAPKEE